ncbi:hypothetical protein AB0H34_12310 [Saccharopolyspora shandongensis]|uniref:hypothetical protein n=1 Tax=Saccharopolyspora shandongensis TaxID=418495 RepID=UPI0033C88992
MTAIVTLERDHPTAVNDPVWIDEVRDKAMQRLDELPVRYHDAEATCPHVIARTRQIA